MRAGANLGVHLAATASSILEGKTVTSLRNRPSDRLVYYAGHDSNLAMLRRLFRVEYSVRSFNQDQYVTGQLMVFELLKAGEEQFVRAYEESLTYQQQRAGGVGVTAGDIDPPSRVYLSIPGCSSGPEGSCPLETFKTLMYNAVNRECATLIDPSVLDPNSDPSIVKSTEQFLKQPGGIVVSLVVVLVSMAVGAGGLVVCQRCTAQKHFQKLEDEEADDAPYTVLYGGRRAGSGGHAAI